MGLFVRYPDDGSGVGDEQDTGTDAAWDGVDSILVAVFSGDAEQHLARVTHEADAARASADAALFEVAATIAAVIACRFDEAAAHARRATDAGAESAAPIARLAEAALLMADAMSGTTHTRELGLTLADAAGSLDADSRGALLRRYLLAEAALSSGAFETADRLLRESGLALGQVSADADGPVDGAALALQLLAARSGAFHGRRDDVRSIAAEFQARSADVPPRALVVLQAIGCFAAAVAGERDRFAALADAVLARTRRDANYLSVGSCLYVAWALRNTGQLQRAAALLVTTAGPELARCKVWDRAFAAEVLVEAALARGDTYRAGLILRQTGALAQHPVAASAIARSRGAVELAQGRAEAAHALALASIRLDEAAGAHTEVLRGRLARAHALEPTAPAEAGALLHEVAREADAAGNESVRTVAARRWRELATPAPGDFAVMTARQRDVAILVAEGHSNSAIAQVLYLSPRTVQTHVQDILALTGTRTRGRVAALLSPGRTVDLSMLTARQLEIARRVARGDRNADVAAALALSSRTVEHHVSAILRALALPSRAALATVTFPAAD